MEILVLLALAGLVWFVARKRSADARARELQAAVEDVKALAEEDVTRFGEELQRLDADVKMHLVDQAMRDGALGVSTSLQYVPDMYNSTDEIIAMAKVAAKYGGAYFSHQRSEANAIDSSLAEVFRIAKETPIRSQIWHLKTAYKPNWGKMPEVLAKIQAARDQGIDVAANMYPWTAGSNGLDACLPPWIREGGRDAFLKRKDRYGH